MQHGHLRMSHPLIITPPDGGISKTIRNHRTESGDRQVANIVLLPRWLGNGSSYEDKASEIRTSHLSVVGREKEGQTGDRIRDFPCS